MGAIFYTFSIHSVRPKSGILADHWGSVNQSESLKGTIQGWGVND